MSGYGFNTVRSYFSEKRFKGDEILTFSVFLFVGIFLIYAGVIIIQTEDIFKQIYEGFAEKTKSTSTISSASTSTQSSVFTGELPEDLTIGQLNKNIKLIRKKSDLNLTVAAGMIISGSILIMYQTYRLFF